MAKKIMILGGDGYIGWSLGIHRAFNTNDDIFLIDSYKKRDYQKTLNISELYTTPLLSEKIYLYELMTGKHNLKSFSINVAHSKTVDSLINSYKPDVILNAAHQPSAPLSMKSFQYARETLQNNEMSCLNVLWAVHNHCPNSLVINMGSAGIYSGIDTDHIPEDKVGLVSQKSCINNSWTPMLATDFYHQSKVNTFGITDLCVNNWGINAVTINQSTVFGQCPINDIKDFRLFSRFNYDHIFGTVLNRFICQSVDKYPLTVYGTGEQTTNIISLCDTLKALNKVIDMPFESGKHRVFNVYTHTMSVLDIANLVASIHNQQTQKIKIISNPRNEPAFTKNECTRDRSLISDDEIDDDLFINTIDKTLALADRFCYNIKPTQFMPTIEW